MCGRMANYFIEIVTEISHTTKYLYFNVFAVHISYYSSATYECANFHAREELIHL